MIENKDLSRGWLMKWTNYIKGYQKRWFVLSHGLLSYYRNQADVFYTCRGTINMANAFISTEDDPCGFVVSNGSTHFFHLRATSEIERQKWVTALHLVKAKAIKTQESDEDEDEDKNEGSTKPLSSKIDDLKTCNDLVTKHGRALQKAINDLQDLGEELIEGVELNKILKLVNEKATLFRITSSAMKSACGEFYDLAQKQEKNFEKFIEHERSQKIRLEQTVEELAKQYNFLEEACREGVPKQKKNTLAKSSRQSSAMTAGQPSTQTGVDSGNTSSDDDDTEFFDAVDVTGNIPYSAGELSTASSDISFQSEKNVTSHKRSSSDYAVSVPETTDNHRMHSASAGDLSSSSISATLKLEKKADVSNEKAMKVKTRRKTLPPKPSQSLNLWNILKNCIGKDLSNISMPVNFNEPISMLQRLTEEMEYSDLLDKAAQAKNSLEEMCYVAAFTISSYSTTSVRVAKPFNPLLGETYEMDRSWEEGWRCLAEQVSHHPPITCFHIEHPDWTYWQDFTANGKFRGNYVQVVPLGVAHLTFCASGSHYTWRKVNTNVHNIIVGKLWVDQSGEMEITNHTTGDICKLKYNAYTYFSRETPRKVTGYVMDKSKVTHYILTGTWDKKIECAEVFFNNNTAGGMPKQTAQTRAPFTLWKMNALPADRELQYNFSDFAMSLNEPDDSVALTDSRFRPDQRLMELGKWDEANSAKGRLEEKQRAKRREREAEAELAKREGRVFEDYKPVWFEKVHDELSGLEIHVYKGGYWEAKEKQDWSMCPDIF
ncbi:oxysterol-binding protein 1-like isoform X2 [Xenia sp. Carnegie-2017]|uniref:oxysterol-binding protein 1-like isoform X2 n=1 Tax=Xenia sp. Carnegie-2017 TaxID=2897299 RepID=UPI001F049869|nr:oxysterol-binding protein 1-like isoform X2 [Xenia sp. Carnegie-2017]